MVFLIEDDEEGEGEAVANENDKDESSENKGMFLNHLLFLWFGERSDKNIDAENKDNTTSDKKSEVKPTASKDDSKSTASNKDKRKASDDFDHEISISLDHKNKSESGSEGRHDSGT